jgi:hypothetical protein
MFDTDMQDPIYTPRDKSYADSPALSPGSMSEFRSMYRSSKWGKILGIKNSYLHTNGRNRKKYAEIENISDFLSEYTSEPSSTSNPQTKRRIPNGKTPLCVQKLHCPNLE